MITVIVGNMFESKAQTLVNTINCVGVMGKGIALEFKKRFPDMYEDYIDRCNRGLVKLGVPYLYKRVILPWILNFPTKEHWRSVSSLQDTVKALEYLERHYREWGITSLAVPPLGCGLGQLEWRVVGPTLYRHLRRLDIEIELFAPFGTPHEELTPAFLDETMRVESAPPSKIQPAWIAVVEILRLIENEPYHWPIGRTMFQKMVYFATQSGIPTGLTFQRGSYGPHSPELKQRITALVNNGLVSEERERNRFSIYVGSTYHDALKVYDKQIETFKPIIEKVANLFMRMSKDQAEIAATVHFAADEFRHQGMKPSEMDILRAVSQWKQKRRPPLSEKEMALTIRNLNILSWINASFSEDLPVSEEEILNV